jgi:hypothetical protein
MEEIWSRIGPAIGTAANHVANFVVALLKSEDGRKAIDGIVHAFTWAASAVDSVVSALEDGKKMLAAQPELQPLAKDFNAFAAEMYGSPFKGFGTWVATRFDQAITAIKDFGTKAIGYAGTIAADMYDAGISIVTGLVDGIKTKIGSAVHVTKDLASSIASSFADALGIQSPSKLFEGYGRNTVEGYEQGERKALPPMMPLEEAATAAPAVPRVTATADAAGASISVVIEQILISAAGGDVTEIATQIRDEIQRVLTAGLMSRGFV